MKKVHYMSRVCERREQSQARHFIKHDVCVCISFINTLIDIMDII